MGCLLQVGREEETTGRYPAGCTIRIQRSAVSPQYKEWMLLLLLTIFLLRCCFG